MSGVIYLILIIVWVLVWNSNKKKKAEKAKEEYELRKRFEAKRALNRELDAEKEARLKRIREGEAERAKRAPGTIGAMAEDDGYDPYATDTNPYGNVADSVMSQNQQGSFMGSNSGFERREKGIRCQSSQVPQSFGGMDSMDGSMNIDGGMGDFGIGMGGSGMNTESMDGTSGFTGAFQKISQVAKEINEARGESSFGETQAHTMEKTPYSTISDTVRSVEVKVKANQDKGAYKPVFEHQPKWMQKLTKQIEGQMQPNLKEAYESQITANVEPAVESSLRFNGSEPANDAYAVNRDAYVLYGKEQGTAPAMADDQISFDATSLRNAVVMSEILGRPRAVRRSIR